LGHRNILTYCKRPFSSIEENDEEIIKRHNELVKPGDITIHGGDFSLIESPAIVYKKYVSRLNGTHIFLEGSHDRWLDKKARQIWCKNFGEIYLVVCHYAFRVWPRSHYNSCQLYGHSHGNLEPVGKQHDMTVDNNNFYPLSLDIVIEIMKSKPDNFNFRRRDK
jgi:calcineurin-like phosphoesterase family protein